jgi:hypothetical protein
VKKAVDAAQDKIVAPLSREERREFMRLMHKLVQLNNDHSRVRLQLSARPARETAQFPLK